jgi:CheY-like chemotaxis protein
MNERRIYYHSKQILVLFERPSDFAQIQGILANPFFSYFNARTAAEAFHVLQKERIDMIVAAVHLENTDTYEFLNRMQMDASWRSIPFVFLSLRRSELARYIDHGLSLAAQALGAAGYLSIDDKSPHEIRTQICSYFEGAQERDTHWMSSPPPPPQDPRMRRSAI